MAQDVLSAPAPSCEARVRAGSAWRPKPHLHLAVLLLWGGAVLWFHPYLSRVLELGTTFVETAALGFFVLFVEIAWIYAAFNIAVVGFGLWRRLRAAGPVEAPALPAGEPPAVALLYTTCNDFSEASVLSCLAQRYANARLYILDDSSDARFRERIDAFAAAHAPAVRVVRRSDRRGYKAGNLNHALRSAAREPFFVLVDADELLPADFIARLVPRLLAMPDCGFIQANHRANPASPSPLARELGPGIDSHWRWYHPIRNDYGFVMLLGHGALVRRETWAAIGGFPEIVSEDLAFALRAREAGWRGFFAEDVVCFEEFPADVRAFRIRHMKWTRGTCEFLLREAGRLLLSRRISWVEKLDVLLPTLNLPLSLLFFLFVIDANLVLTELFGRIEHMTWTFGGSEWHVPVLRLDPGFDVLNRVDLFVVTLFAFASPILCFILDMWRRPLQLFRFLGRSTALYGALGPLSSIGVLLFAATRRAVFHVTADAASRATAGHAAPPAWPAEVPLISPYDWLADELRDVARRSHPDQPLVQLLEIACGATLAWMALASMQLAFLGLALAYLMLPLLHHLRWDSPIVRSMIQVPLLLITLGVGLGSLSLLGVQTVFFGYGFHF